MERKRPILKGDLDQREAQIQEYQEERHTDRTTATLQELAKEQDDLHKKKDNKGA